MGHIIPTTQIYAKVETLDSLWYCDKGTQTREVDMSATTANTPSCTEMNASRIAEILLEKIIKEIGNSGTLSELQEYPEYKRLRTFDEEINIKVLLEKLTEEPDSHAILLILSDLFRGKLDLPLNVIEGESGCLYKKYIEYAIGCGYISR
ncbi:MAG: hypothetical protein ACYC8S_02990 [Minisyncoccota bacterium]